MRVLLTTDAVGGVWTFTRELTQHLLSRGDSVALVSFGRALSCEQSEWAAALSSRSARRFEVHASDAPLEWMQTNDVSWQHGSKVLLKVASSFGPDILHSNQFCWGALPLEVPKVLTAHSDVRSWAHACRPEALAPSRWLERYDVLVQDGLEGADAVVAPTAWMREGLREHYKVAAPFEVIANGRTLRVSDRERRRELRAVSVGRMWDEGKGLSILSEIALPLPALLVGEQVFEDAARGAMPPGVTLLQTLDQASLVDLLSTSSIYLATSLYEPFGLAPLEAALCGCAIVARELPSLREVWADAALYFEDARGLNSVLMDLVNDPEKLQRTRTAAAGRAQRFTAERMAESYAALYRRLIAGVPARMPQADEELHAA